MGAKAAVSRGARPWAPIPTNRAPPAADPPRVVVRAGRVGDLGWTFHRQAVVYKEEFGYGDLFETYLAEGLPPYLENFDAARDRLWIAERGDDARIVGFVAVHHVEEAPTGASRRDGAAGSGSVDDRPRWAKLRWFLVEKEARGDGVGTRLMREAVEFCRRAGYAGVFLWTVNDLHAARAVYERAGFVLAEEKTDPCPWAPWGREQRWGLTFA